MKKRANQRARRWSERLETGMRNFGRLIFFQHIMEILKILNNSALMLIFSELAGMNTIIVFIQGAPIVGI